VSADGAGLLLARAVVGGETWTCRVEGGDLVRLAGSVLAPGAETGERAPIAAARLLSPCEPQHVYVVLGGFFRDGDDQPRPPRLVPKVVSSVSGDGGEIVVPRFVEGPLWAEAELAVVVGSPLYRSSADEAAGAILGYGVFDDASAAGYLEQGPSGYFQAKSIETFASLGPWLRTDLGEDDLRRGLRIEARVNGETRATGTTARARNTPAEVLAFLSTWVALRPGDVVALGTPQPCEVRPGDEVELEVEGIGVLRNRFVAEPER
jgi:2-keto-4-pentenoate hydratase/2-oxohepta-3-ene-1,7-dioic acid hydratase in catechol pathway